MVTDPTPTVSATRDAFDDPDMGRGGPAESATPEPDEVEQGEPAELVASAGTVDLVWEPTPTTRRLFSYDLTECTLDGTDFNITGVGVEDATGAASTVTMAVTAAELLHERTGTYHGSGHVTFTADGSEVVSDGRIYSTPEGYTGPSMFDYRVTDTTVDLKAVWWIGEAESGAGAVMVHCDA